MSLGLDDGDENINCFHKFSSCRENINFLWKIKKEDGTCAINFKDMVEDIVK
jgi:hypothetical protein